MYSGIKLLTSTPNRTVEVIFKYTAVEAAEIIKYMDCFKFRELCKNGCCNYRKNGRAHPLPPLMRNTLKILNILAFACCQLICPSSPI